VTRTYEKGGIKIGHHISISRHFFIMSLKDQNFEQRETYMTYLVKNGDLVGDLSG